MQKGWRGWHVGAAHRGHADAPWDGRPILSCCKDPGEGGGLGIVYCSAQETHSTSLQTQRCPVPTHGCFRGWLTILGLSSWLLHFPRLKSF